MPGKVNWKTYVDKIFELKAVALDKALDELREWKNLHNDLQRKMSDQSKQFVSWPNLWTVVVGMAMFVLGLAMYLKK